MQWLDMNKGDVSVSRDGIKCKGLLAVAAINKSNEAMMPGRVIKSCMIYACDDAILRDCRLTRSFGSAGEETSQPEYDGTLVLLHHLV